MNFVGIDISINSTGISIARNNEILLINYTVMKPNYTWIKKTMGLIDYEFINYVYKDIENYSEKEIIKLKEFDKVSDSIFNKIYTNIDKNRTTYICIEGYNYNSFTNNSIIDIVTLSTLIRKKLLDIPNLEQIIILSPKTVKSELCKKIYGETIIEKVNKNGVKKITKVINKNNTGVSGGDFNKHDIMRAIVELNIDSKLNEFLKQNKDSLLSMKNIPNPFSDILDSLSILLLLKDSVYDILVSNS